MAEQKSRNILILHSSSDLYGASKILLFTVSSLKKNHKVYVALSEDGELATALKEIGIEVIFCRLGILRRKYFSIAGLLNRYEVIKQAKKQLGDLVIEKKIDVIYSNTTAVLVGAFLAKATKTKHIWHVHEIIKSPGFFVKFIGWCLNKYSDKVIVVSDAVKRHWEKFVASEKIVTIYNGIDYSPFLEGNSKLRTELNIADDQILIGMIARVHFWKGQEYFLNIASHILKRFPNAKFVMVGDAFPGNEYLYEKIDEIKNKEGLNQAVTDLGYRTDIANIISGLDIFILPSILPDPFPTVILEAMASGKPVVATMHGGATEMLENNKTGLLIPWDDAKAAADSTEALIRDKQMREIMGMNARARVLKNFSLESYQQNFAALINTLH